MNLNKMTFTNEPKEAEQTLGFITVKLSYDPLHGVTCIQDIDRTTGIERVVFMTDEQMLFIRDWFNNSVVVSGGK